MQFAREKVDEAFFREIMPLLQNNFTEISRFQDIQLNPDFEKYAKMESLDGLRTFTVRDKFGFLVGYAIFFLNFNLHYKDSLQASQDVIYLERSKRGAGVGKSFIQWCDEQLRNEGAELVYHHVKEKLEEKLHFGALLEKIGYERVERIYVRRLDGGQ